jgi:hypothetical protein
MIKNKTASAKTIMVEKTLFQSGPFDIASIEN